MQLSSVSEENKLLPASMLRLLGGRNLSPVDVTNLFSWNLQELPELCALKDLEKSSQRIIKALEQNEKIGIYGDYDVDGTTSCALFYHFFQMLNVTPYLFQPSRFVEGYGLHVSSIEHALEKEIKILITVDCGISSHEAAFFAKDKNIDLIITDHHTDGALEIPVAFAVVNPNRQDEDKNSPLKALAGVGVAFALCVQIKKDLEKKGKTIPSLYPLLQFVAIGTICDMAPLTPLNLKLVRHGLKQIPKSSYQGILSFFPPEEREVDVMSSEKISFNVGPLINSKGRIDHPEKALELLTAENNKKAFECYSHLEISNRKRKMLQAQVFDEAKKQVLQTLHTEDLTISLVCKDDWHEGVIGIVASKLVETFEVPAMVFTQSEEGILKGSARSVEGLNMFEILKTHEDLFLKFGGHKQAAGLSLLKKNFPLFKERMEAHMRSIPFIQRTKQKHFDIELMPEEVNVELVRYLSRMEPFGVGNPKPVFRMRSLKVDSYEILKNEHVRWNLSSLKNPLLKFQGISFFYIGKWNEPHPSEVFKATGDIQAQFTLGINRFKGNEYLQLMVDKMVISL